MTNFDLLRGTTITILAVIAGLGPAGAPAADWPHWRGPQRSDVVDEHSGWRDGHWPLQELWHTDVGEGASSPLVIGEHVYVLGWSGEREHLLCLEARTGNTVWRADYAAPRYGRQATGDQGIYSGPSSTPEYDPETGWLYSLGIDGELRCLDVRDRGRLVWRLNLYDQYHVGQRPDVGGKRAGASRRDYGYTTSPLVQSGTLIIEVGDTQSGTVKGFDKRTGKELWTSACRDEAGHSGGLVPIVVDGIPCAAVLTMRHLLLVRLDAGHEGETLAQHPWTTDFGNNIPTPAVDGNWIIVTSSYNQSAMCCLAASRDGLREVWRIENPSGVCSPVIHKGHIYWAWRGIHCVDLATGEENWLAPAVGTPASCIITSDDRLIVFADNGDLHLAETAVRSPDKYTQLDRRRGLFGTECWPHVVLADGRLYCRDRAGALTCFSVSDPAK
jgi:outer membrane protein assembly factor BamB